MRLFPLVLAGICTFFALPAAARVPVERFAFLIGSNDGGPGRVLLRFATSDAQSVSRVLEQLGGISQEHRVVLLNPNRSALLAGLAQLGAQIREAHTRAERTELLFYYSGHSDESGLLLNNELLPYLDLRAAIDSLSADVRIVVLDSCSSGAMIRMKGGKRTAPFLIDDSTAVRGHAFLTASSANEAAQESDRIGASYFTYALLTGLRGAADASRDGRITLHEAYQYAFNETLAHTERTQAGPQHPSYDIQLVGTGDLVLTDLRGSSAGLVLGAELDGRLYLRNSAGHLIVELRKAVGAPIELGLEPDHYGVTLESGGKVYSAQIELFEGRRFELNSSRLRMVKPEVVALRGGLDKSVVLEQSSYRTIPLNLSIVPPLELYPTENGEPVINHFVLSLFFGRSTALRGIQLSQGANQVLENAAGVQVGEVNLVGGSLNGAQIGELFNMTGKESKGLQISTVNYAKSSFDGAQLGVALNLINAPSHAVQVGGVNYAEGLHGAQIAFGVNVLRSESTAVQISNINLATGDLHGGQIGLVNIGTKIGLTQIGLVNIADECDYPLGLINLVRKGYQAISIWGSNATVANLGIKLGGRRLYTLLGTAMQPRSKNRRWSPLVGLGFHFGGDENLFLDVDAVSAAFFDVNFDEHNNTQLVSLRIMAGWKILPHLALVGGPTLNFMRSPPGENNDNFIPSETPQWKKETRNGTILRFFPGLAVGLQF